MTFHVRVRRESFAAVSSGDPMVILFDAASAEPLAGDLGEGIRIVIAKVDADGLVLRPAGRPDVEAEALVELLQPPAGCVAIVGKDETSLGKLTEWWRRRSGECPLVVAETAGGRARAALLSKLCRALSAELRQNARLAVDALSSLSRLREEYEEVRDLVAQLDRHLSGRRIGELALVSDYPPGATAFAPLRDLRQQSIRQPLDLPGRQLAALAIHIAAVGERAQGIHRVLDTRDLDRGGAPAVVDAPAARRQDRSAHMGVRAGVLKCACRLRARRARACAEQNEGRRSRDHGQKPPRRLHSPLLLCPRSPPRRAATAIIPASPAPFTSATSRDIESSRKTPVSATCPPDSA